MTELLISADWKGKGHNSILIIVNRPPKIVYYKSLKITLDAPRLAEVILDRVISARLNCD